MSPILSIPKIETANTIYLIFHLSFILLGAVYRLLYNNLTCQAELRRRNDRHETYNNCNEL